MVCVWTIHASPRGWLLFFLFSALYADCLYIHLILPETSTKLSVIYVLWLFNSDIHFSCPLFLLIQIFTDLISLKLSLGSYIALFARD